MAVCTNGLFLPVLILLMGAFVSMVYMKNHSETIRQSNLVASPRIGNVLVHNEEGPWPECVGLSFRSCSNLIQSQFSDRDNDDENDKLNIIPVEPGQAVTRDFQTNRVFVYVDEDGLVTEIPGRG